MENLLFSFGSIKLEWHSVLLSFLLAFILSTAVATVYEKTFQGLSWSRGLLHSMILGSMICCLLMIAIGDNVARGIGIVGSLAVIRFRTNLRDPRDLIFLFAAFGVGVASGVQSYDAAIIGCIVFCVIAYAMHHSPFGTQRPHDGLIRFQASSGAATSELIVSIMGRIPRHFALVTMRSIAQGEQVEYAYQVKLAKPDDGIRLIRELEAVEGLRGLTYMNQQTTVEV